MVLTVNITWMSVAIIASKYFEDPCISIQYDVLYFNHENVFTQNNNL